MSPSENSPGSKVPGHLREAGICLTGSMGLEIPRTWQNMVPRRENLEPVGYAGLGSVREL